MNSYIDWVNVIGGFLFWDYFLLIFLVSGMVRDEIGDLSLCSYLCLYRKFMVVFLFR